MNQRDPEYDRFGPWVIEIGDEDPPPPLFVPHLTRSEAPLLGLNGGCFVGHGRSNSTAIKNSILQAAEFCESEVHLKIRDKVAELHSQEERLLGDERPQGVNS